MSPYRPACAVLNGNWALWGIACRRAERRECATFTHICVARSDYALRDHHGVPRPPADRPEPAPLYDHPASRMIRHGEGPQGTVQAPRTAVEQLKGRADLEFEDFTRLGASVGGSYPRAPAATPRCGRQARHPRAPLGGGRQAKGRPDRRHVNGDRPDDRKVNPRFVPAAESSANVKGPCGQRLPGRASGQGQMAAAHYGEHRTRLTGRLSRPAVIARLRSAGGR